MEEAALDLAAKGFWPFPCRERDKRPLTPNGFKNSSKSERQILEWWDRHPSANIGVDLGRSGCVIVDIDSKCGADPDRVIAEFGLDEGKLVRVETGEAPPQDQKHPFSLEGLRGAQLWFRGAHPTSDTTIAGVQLRGPGTYAVAPPSIHPSGVAYVGRLPPTERLPKLPAPVLEVVKRKQGQPAPRVEDVIQEGSRHEGLMSLAGTMRRRGMGGEEILGALSVINQRRCRPVLDAGEVEHIAEVAGRYEPADSVFAKRSNNGQPQTAGGGKEAQAGTNTWAPVDLTELITGEYTQEPPALLRRSDGICLLYRERVHEVRGEPESCKGWLALLACAERLAVDESVLYVDFEDSAPAVVDRLLELGADGDSIVRRFYYVRPDEPLADPSALLTLEPKLAVLDGVTEALALHGLDLRDNVDIAKWLALLPRPLQRSGAAVVLIDHVTKDRDNRGRWSIGAQHKLAGVDVAYLLETVEPFGRGREGLVRIAVHKDRPGFVRRHAAEKRVADLRLASRDEGGVSCQLEAPVEHRVFRPTGYMEKVSRVLEAQPGLSKRSIRTAVGGKTGYCDLALELLAAEGFVAVERDGQARRHRAARPFREAEDLKRDHRDPTVTHRDPSTEGHGVGNRDPVTPVIRGHGHGPTDRPKVTRDRDPESRVTVSASPSATPASLPCGHDGPARLTAHGWRCSVCDAYIERKA